MECEEGLQFDYRDCGPSYFDNRNKTYYNEPQDLSRNYVHAHNDVYYTPPEIDNNFLQENHSNHEFIQYVNEPVYSSEGPQQTQESQGKHKSNSHDMLEYLPLEYFERQDRQISHGREQQAQQIFNGAVNCLDDRLPDLGGIDVWCEESQSSNQSLSQSHEFINNGQHDISFADCDTNPASVQSPIMAPTVLGLSPAAPDSTMNLLHDYNYEEIPPPPADSLRDFYLDMQKYPTSYKRNTYPKALPYNPPQTNTAFKPNKVIQRATLTPPQSVFGRKITETPPYQDHSTNFYYEASSSDRWETPMSVGPSEPVQCDYTPDIPCQMNYVDNIFDTAPDSVHMEPLDLREASPPSTVTTTPKSQIITKKKSTKDDADSQEIEAKKKRMCYICDLELESLSDLKEHNKKHKLEDKVKCSHCDVSVVNSVTLKNHMRLHTGEKPWKCDDCGKEFSWHSGYVSHLRMHTGDKPYTCKFCDKKFRLLSTMKSHELTHTGCKPFACDQCDSKFTQRSALKRHMLTHSDVRAYHCDKCDTFLRSRETYTRHVNLHAKRAELSCVDCGIGYTNPKRLAAHLVKCQSKTSETTKKFTCTECRAKFSRKSRLTTHMKHHPKTSFQTLDQSQALDDHNLSHPSDCDTILEQDEIYEPILERPDIPKVIRSHPTLLHQNVPVDKVLSELLDNMSGGKQSLGNKWNRPTNGNV